MNLDSVCRACLAFLRLGNLLPLLLAFRSFALLVLHLTRIQSQKQLEFGRCERHKLHAACVQVMQHSNYEYTAARTASTTSRLNNMKRKKKKHKRACFLRRSALARSRV